MTNKYTYQCTTCGSTDVLFDAYASWSEHHQEFCVDNVMDGGHYCNKCDKECKTEKVPLPFLDMTLVQALKLHTLLPDDECDIWEDRVIGTFPCDVHIFMDDEVDDLIHVEIYRSYINPNGTRSTDCSTFYGGYDHAK